VADYREAFIGIDVAKLRNAVAVADAGRVFAVAVARVVEDRRRRVRPAEGPVVAHIGP